MQDGMGEYIYGIHLDQVVCLSVLKNAIRVVKKKSMINARGPQTSVYLHLMVAAGRRREILADKGIRSWARQV